VCFQSKVKNMLPSPRYQILLVIASFGAALLAVAQQSVVAGELGKTPPIKIAVFEFELDDVSAAGASDTKETDGDLSRMQLVTAEARRVLAQSGRYSLVDTNGVDAQPVKERSLRTCNGCDAGIALKLGAEQSMVGVVTRVANTEYYAALSITDTRTGKVINQQTAFFTGADDAWASGVRMLIKHQVLTSANQRP
jgi:hypothetical protein